MKNAILITIILGMLGWAVYEYVNSSNEDSTVEEGTESDEVGILKGQIAPDFELLTLEGEKVRLSDYRGQRVMLNFWATWCPPCRAEMPDMQNFQEDKNVKVLAVNLLEKESNQDNVQAFIDELGLTMTVPLDEESVVSNQYQIMAYPTTFMIDSSGRIQFTAKGALNYDMMVQEFEKME